MWPVFRLCCLCFQYLGISGPIRWLFSSRNSKVNAVIRLEIRIICYRILSFLAQFFLCGLCFACVSNVSGFSGQFRGYFRAEIGRFAREPDKNSGEFVIGFCRFWPILACVACVSPVLPVFPTFRDFWAIPAAVSESDPGQKYLSEFVDFGPFWPNLACVACVSPVFPTFRNFRTTLEAVSESDSGHKYLSEFVYFGPFWPNLACVACVSPVLPVFRILVEIWAIPVAIFGSGRGKLRQKID